jgi:hypothetical protein
VTLATYAQIVPGDTNSYFFLFSRLNLYYYSAENQFLRLNLYFYSAENQISALHVINFYCNFGVSKQNNLNPKVSSMFASVR